MVEFMTEGQRNLIKFNKQPRLSQLANILSTGIPTEQQLQDQVV